MTLPATASFCILVAITTCSYAQDAIESGRTGPSKGDVVSRIEKRVADLSARIDALTTRVQRLERPMASQKTHELNSSDSKVRSSRIISEQGGFLRGEQPTDLTIQVYQLANANARSIVRIVSKLLPEVEAKKVRIAVDKRTNCVLAYGTAQDLGIIEALVARLDESVESNVNE